MMIWTIPGGVGGITVVRCNVNIFLYEKCQALKLSIAVLPKEGYKAMAELHGGSCPIQSCTGNSPFSLDY